MSNDRSCSSFFCEFQKECLYYTRQSTEYGDVIKKVDNAKKSYYLRPALLVPSSFLNDKEVYYDESGQQLTNLGVYVQSIAGGKISENIRKKFCQFIY